MSDRRSLKTRPLPRHSLKRRSSGTSISGVTFPQNGDLAYAANRSPDSVVISIPPSRTPRSWTRRRVEGWSQSRVFHILDAWRSRTDRPDLLQIVRQRARNLLAVTGFADDVVYLMSTHGDGLRVSGRLDVP